MKILLGCGDKKLPGYLTVDIDPAVGADFTCSADALYFCRTGEADEIRMQAVYEHLYHTERERALEEWVRCLRPGGLLKIEWIPNGAVSALKYAQHMQSEANNVIGCTLINCGPTDEFPHFDLTMLERVTCGAVGLHAEQTHQVHKGLFSRAKVREELSRYGLVVDVCHNFTFPGERGDPYNICVEAHKP